MKKFLRLFAVLFSFWLLATPVLVGAIQDGKASDPNTNSTTGSGYTSPDQNTTYIDDSNPGESTGEKAPEQVSSDTVNEPSTGQTASTQSDTNSITDITKRSWGWLVALATTAAIVFVARLFVERE